MSETISRFIKQYDIEDIDMATQYDAGRVCVNNGEYIISYEMQGALNTFSVGQPVFDKDGNLMGYLGIGLYAHLDYATSKSIRIPCEYWKICLPTKYCECGKKVYTYWQNELRISDKAESEDK